MNDPTFWWRVLAGAIVLGAFIVHDVYENGRNARRPKEYLFLAAVTTFAMGYGIVHDFVTWSIAPEYYVLGKGLASAKDHFSWEVVKLAMLATWSVGLVGSGLLLLANNPDKQGRTLPYSTLVAMPLIPFAASVACEGVGALLFGMFPAYFAKLLRDQHFREVVGDRFMLVWGMHFGAYIGGGIGLTIAVARVYFHKRRLSIATGDSDRDN